MNYLLRASFAMVLAANFSAHAARNDFDGDRRSDFATCEPDGGMRPVTRSAPHDRGARAARSRVPPLIDTSPFAYTFWYLVGADGNVLFVSFNPESMTIQLQADNPLNAQFGPYRVRGNTALAYCPAQFGSPPFVMLAIIDPAASVLSGIFNAGDGNVYFVGYPFSSLY